MGGKGKAWEDKREGLQSGCKVREKNTLKQTKGLREGVYQREDYIHHRTGTVCRAGHFNTVTLPCYSKCCVLK